jgi:outer membrane protein OmpA-like peptidoglycan-associated protein
MYAPVSVAASEFTPILYICDCHDRACLIFARQAFIAIGESMRLVIRLLFFLVVPLCGIAQDTAALKVTPKEKTPWLYVGGYLDYNRNVFKANFPYFPNQVSCNQSYKNGTGHGVAIGLLADYPFTPVFSAGARLGYATLGGTLTTNSIIGYSASVGSNQQTPDQVETQYALEASIGALSFEPMMNMTLFGKVRVSAGLRADFLLSSTYSESERLIRPDYAFFLPDSTRVRSERSGLIPNVQALQTAATGSVAVDIPVSSKIIIAPEIRYQLALNALSDVDWSVSTIQFGIGVRSPLYSSPPPVYNRDTMLVRDTTVIARVDASQQKCTLIETSITKKEQQSRVDDQLFVNELYTVTEKYSLVVPRLAQLNVNVEAYTLAPNGERAQLKEFVVEETEIEENYSLLPQIFFPEGEARLQRTGMSLIDKSRTEGFSESTLSKNTIEVYHDLLNIIGQRMRENSAETITLVGCNSNVGDERNNLDLSKARAEGVRRYLQEVWGIDASRINIKAMNLPASPSNNMSEDGQAENRRVEIVPANPSLLRAVAIKNATVRSSPRVIDVVPSVYSEAGLASWSARITQEGRELRSFSGESTPEKYVWNVTGDPYPKLEKPVTISYEAVDRTGQRKSNAVSVDVKQMSIRRKRFEQKDDKRIDRFSLIVFDFNKADLNADNKRILEEVQSRIEPNSVVTIAGYADKSGDAEYNRDLARRRCMEVEKVIAVKSVKPLISPIGSDILLYDNSTPEGRAYCRTVQIVIETPIK